MALFSNQIVNRIHLSWILSGDKIGELAGWKSCCFIWSKKQKNKQNNSNNAPRVKPDMLAPTPYQSSFISGSDNFVTWFFWGNKQTEFLVHILLKNSNQTWSIFCLNVVGTSLVSFFLLNERYTARAGALFTEEKSLRLIRQTVRKMQSIFPFCIAIISSQNWSAWSPLNHFLMFIFVRSVLLVKLDSAQDLPAKDDDLLPDVFVKTQLIPSRKRVYISKVHRETANPVFNEAYEFDIEYPELQQQRLLFQILDYDCMSRYKPIGEVSVRLAELGTHGFNILREISLCVYISRPQKESSLWGPLSHRFFDVNYVYIAFLKYSHCKYRVIIIVLDFPLDVTPDSLNTSGAPIENMV